MEESAVSFPSCISTDAPFRGSCLPARSFGMGGIPLMILRFWRSIMDCGNNGGRVPRPVLPQCVSKPVGVTHCQKGQICRGRQLPKCRPARVANRSWSHKKGGYVRSRKGTVIGSNQQQGHIPRKYGRESTPGCAAKR
jgi:hypothetical protein